MHHDCSDCDVAVHGSVDIMRESKKGKVQKERATLWGGEKERGGCTGEEGRFLLLQLLAASNQHGRPPVQFHARVPRL